MTAPASAEDILAQLEAHFEDQEHLVLQGVTYVPIAYIVHRLNVVLGLGGWTLEVLREGYEESADELWCYGELRAVLPDGTRIKRQQYGGVKVKRYTKDGPLKGTPINWSDDKKAAASDSLKKCAQQLGVGAYLADKEEAAVIAEHVHAGRGQQRRTVDPSTGEVLECADCAQPLKLVRFKDNTTWDPQRMARESRERYGKTLCMDCYRQAKEARARDGARP